MDINRILDRINILVEDIRNGGGTTLLTEVQAAVTELQQAEVIITNTYNNTLSKLNRIKGATNYSRTFSYYSTTDNVTSIVHTGTTALGSETVTETIDYLDEAGGDFRVNTIIYS